MRLIDAAMASLYLNTEACKQIQQMPTVDAVPVRHGKWIRLGQKHDGGYLWIRCSVCGNEDIDSPVCMTKYCPNCGARMDG